MKPYKLLPFVMCLGLILSACRSAVTPPAGEAVQPTARVAATPQIVTAAETAAEPAPPPKPHGLRFDAPPYALNGPYQVGVRYFTIPARYKTDRELTASLWYPALNPDNKPAEIVYEQQFKPGKMPPIKVLGHALLDAAPDSSGAPYPLVVYSHAHWSFGQELPYLTEHLASRGFVVISVDHEDNWSTDMGPMAYEALVRRTQEVTRQIDYAESLSASGDSLSGMIAAYKVGVAGWSMGSVTSLAAAGARLDLAALRAWCAEDPRHAELNAWACVDVLGREAEMAGFAGFSEVPAGLWPDWRDKRVGAAVRLSGEFLVYGSHGFESVDVPVLFLHGSGEEAANPGVEMGQPYENVASSRKAQVVFDHGEHMMYNSSCADSPTIVALGFAMFCSDPVWDMDRAHDLINHFTTAFLLAELKWDVEAAAALAPKQVSFPGIQYQSTGYGLAGEPEARLDPETVAKIEALIKKTMAEHKIPGFAIGIVKDGQVAYTKGFGVAEVGTDKPATPQSVFQMASISKSFTALAIMQLVEQGRVKLDAPVTDYLPYFTMADDRYRDITVRQLLNHTSGLSDDFGHEFKDTPAPMAQAVRDLADQELLATPGEKWSYSGVAFALLGEVVAWVSGMDFESYMQKYLLGPLGMSHSTFVPGKADAKLLMTPHINAEAGGVKASTIMECDARSQAACTLYSSCDDMIKYARFALNRGELDGERLVSRKTFDELWNSQVSTPWLEGMGPRYGPPMAEYGLGWLLGEADGHRLAGHPGAVAGWNSQIQLAADDGLAVITMANWKDAAPFPATFAAIDVLYLLLGIQPEPVALAYQPRYEPAACKYPVPAGEKMECGYLTVPEDRSKPGGPTVRLHVTNYKSTSTAPAPDPVFIVAGGAGTSGVVYMNVIRNLAFGKALRAERDVLFLDQRGTNFSEPALYCPELAVNPADVASLPFAKEVAARVEKIQACHDRLAKEGINLGAYNEREIAADYADLRVALGYDQVNLYGMSLGTRLAMIAMRDHPEGLRSVILDSVLPPEVNILTSDPPGVQAALKTLFGACAADATCNKAYPDLEAAFYEVAGRLRATPALVEVTTDKGERLKVTVDDLSFVEFLLESLFNRAIAPMPAGIYAAKGGDYTAIAKARLAPARMRQPGEVGPGSMADAYGHWFSFWCTGDGGAISDADLSAIFGAAGLNPSVRDRSWAVRVEAIHAPCASWKVPVLDPRIADQPMTSDIPTLLLEGTFDFFTEPSLVQASAKRLSKSYFYSLPTGHLIAWFSPCGDKLALDFLRDPSKAPDAGCIGEMKVAWVLPK